ncbi:MAG: PilZ domain-containing protein [Candidatus Omnitrophota bacterium]
MLEITLKIFNSIAILDLSGTIDIDSSGLVEKVGWCLENGHKDILCDFENVTLVDYAGLSVLTIAYKNVINHEGRMKFVNVATHIKNNFSLVCIDRVFEIYDDEESALRDFEEDRVISQIQKKNLRRRFQRIELDIDVQFKSKSKAEEFHRGKVLNLSAVGILVFSEKVYPLGEILDLKISLMPRPGSIEVDTKVVWFVQQELQPQIYPGMGLEFHNVDSDTQKKIIEFVDRNLPLGTIPGCQ